MLKGLSNGSLDTYCESTSYMIRHEPDETTRAHEVTDLDAECLRQDDPHIMRWRPLLRMIPEGCWASADEAARNIAIYRSDGIDGEPDDDYKSFGGPIKGLWD